MNAPVVPARTLRRIVELATRAPSVHNTQPWRWRGRDGVLELCADRTRQLPTTDPEGRNLVISCGAALHQAVVAADALGWVTTVRRLPDPDEPDLLAVLSFRPGATSPQAADLLEAIGRRCTDRRRFTSWPVPDERLAHLAAHATAHGLHAVALVDVSERFRAERLVNQAVDRMLRRGPALVEQQSWVDRSSADGVPSAVLPMLVGEGGRRPTRFGSGRLDDIGGRDVEGADGLVVLCSPDDDAGAWLRAGEALSDMWLAATLDGLSLVPLSQVIEVPELRDAFRLDVLGGLAHPLLVVRVGWQAISRSELPQTPRRPVDEVLELA